MKRGKIKDEYFVNMLKYCFLVWASQGGWDNWELVVPSRETNCIEQRNDCKKNPASSDLDFFLHASFKICCSEAIKSEYTLKRRLKRNESVLFEILCTPAMFLPRLTGYDSVGQAQACTVI